MGVRTKFFQDELLDLQCSSMIMFGCPQKELIKTGQFPFDMRAPQKQLADMLTKLCYGCSTFTHHQNRMLTAAFQNPLVLPSLSNPFTRCRTPTLRYAWRSPESRCVLRNMKAQTPTLIGENFVMKQSSKGEQSQRKLTSKQCGEASESQLSLPRSHSRRK